MTTPPSTVAPENTIEVRGPEYSDKLLSYRPKDVLLFVENASCSRRSGNSQHLTDGIMEKYPYVDPFKNRVQEPATKRNLATKETRASCGTAELFYPPSGWKDPIDGSPGQVVACLIMTLDYGASSDSPFRISAHRFPGAQADTEQARLQWLKEALVAADKSAPKDFTFSTAYGAACTRTYLPSESVHQVLLKFQRETGRRMILYSQYYDSPPPVLLSEGET